MTKLRVESFTISIDGFGAGHDQSLENPLGVGGTALHGWAFATRTFQAHLFGSKDGETGLDDDFAARLPQCWCLDYGQKYVRASARSLA